MSIPEPLELDYITIKGFKSIESITKLALSAINVIIGPNGSGKSNFIGVFSFLHAIREGRLQEYVAKAGGADRILHFGSKTTNAIEIQISFKNEANQYSLKLEPTEADELYPASEEVCYWDKQAYPDKPYDRPLVSRPGKEAAISESGVRGIAGWVREHLGNWRLYHFHDTSVLSPMKKTADLNDNSFLRPDGSNLAAFLYFLRTKENESYELIRSTVQRVTPFFDDFQLQPTKLNPDKIRIEWRHRNSDKYFDVSSLSDGTLRFIALATLFLQPEPYRPSVILVDEPELGLHPYAITMLASLIKMASKTTQVIIATQSSMLLDHFAPEDVLVAERSNGGVQFTRLESQRLASWLSEYSLGQLWEKNEFGGRPSGAQ
jgi:predicted ATPase